MDETTCSFCHTPLPVESRFCLSCGANLSDPEASTRQRTSLKELLEALRVAVEGRYRVTDMLGRGGMGAVFLAEDLRLGRRVAIKVLRPELADDGFVRRFEREARIAAGLDHPNIVPIYAVEQVGDFHYFVMKYVAGQSLDDLLAERPVSPESARRILAQAAAGLAHAHERGVIHRDVKPSNIMLDEAGRVLITDFGISKALQEGSQYTSTGQMVGTPSYLSPEQAQGIPLDGRSDQYSLAVVGYQMVVGRLPFVAENVHALLYKHIHETPTPALDARPEIPADLSEVLQRALAKAPAERFGSMEKFAAAVCPDCPAPGTWPAVVPARRRRRRLLAASIALAALLAAAAALTVWQGGRLLPAELADSTGSPAADDSVVPMLPDTAPGLTPGGTPAPSDTVRTEFPAPPVDSAKPRMADTVFPPKRAPKPSPTRTKPPPEAVVPSPPRVGYLTVNAVPYGSVSIDGVEVGDTPIVTHELSPGDHVVRITREGYRAESVTVTITAGNEVRVSRPLRREP